MATIRISAAVAALAALTAPAAAQAPSLAGKNVQMIIGAGTGGSQELWGRLVARHIGKHLPGKPTVLPQNMPGAGSMAAANHIFNVSPRDGSEIGLFAGNITIDPLMGSTQHKYDARRFSWIGAPS